MTAPALIRTDVRQNTEEWLNLRRTGVTASEMPTLMGNRDGLHELWAFKAGLLEREPIDPATQEMFDIGHELEPVIATRYTKMTGRRIKAVEAMVRHPEIPWAFASLDRVSAVAGERIIVELKWVPWSQEWSGPEPVPAVVQDQVQWQLFVTGYPVAHVAVLRGAKVEWHEVLPDPAYQEAELRVAEWFRGLVERREMPTVDGHEKTRRSIARLYPADDGTLAEPTAALEALARDERAADRAAKAAVEEHERLRNVLRVALQEHAGVEGDGWRVVFRKNADSTKVVTDHAAIAGDYRRLLEQLLLQGDASVRGALRDAGFDPDQPDVLDVIAGLHTRNETVKGSRPLVVRLKDEETSKWL